MARMIPAHISEINNSAERRMAELLEHALPADVVVIHGRHILLDTESSGLLPRELDFIVIDPRQGVLVIEVKGGSLRYVREKRKWQFVTTEHEEQIFVDPLNQANDGMHAIKKVLENHIPHFKKKYRVGCAIAFPESIYEGELPPNLNAATLFDARSCEITSISDALQGAYSKWKADVTTLSSTEIETIVRVLSPLYAVEQTRHSAFTEFQKRVTLVTTEQQEIIEGYLQTTRQAAIPGVAGSGKTMIAAAFAEQEAQKGKRVLFLCYNKSLAKWLRSNHEDAGGELSNLEFENYHAFVAKLCREYERPWPSKQRDQESFWGTYVPDQLFDIATNLLPAERKYDTIIVDEGQDFQARWWQSIMPLFRCPEAEQTMFVFYDPDQNIYQSTPAIPSFLPKSFPMTTNCRNTQRIGTHCASIIPTQMRVSKLSPRGKEPLQTSHTQLIAAIEEAIQQALCVVAEEQRLRLNQVAVLCLGVKSSLLQRYAKRVGFTSDVDTWRANKGILIADSGAFKGLESDLVLFIDNDRRDTPDIQAKRYVAQTRAKFELHVYEVR